MITIARHLSFVPPRRDKDASRQWFSWFPGIFQRTCLLLGFIAFFQSSAECGMLPEQYLQNGGYGISRNGKILATHRANDPFIAASTFKLLTALTALDTFGSEYRYTTDFFLDDQQVLYIKGSGDPFLTSEALSHIAGQLKQRGLTRLSALYLDDFSFRLEQPHPPGSKNSTNPYDAPNGALAVNFNSVILTKEPNRTIRSGEAQTPLLRITEEIGRQLPPGDHRVNIDAFALPGTLPAPLRYTVELFQAKLDQAGIEVPLILRRARVPDTAVPVYTYTSQYTVKQMVEASLRYSNNYIANQLALTAGAHRFGQPATWQKAQQLLESYAQKQLGISGNALQVSEASGLSRDNLITPAAMLTILESFRPYRDLLPEKHGIRLKSGTMNDIYCYAGYLETSTGTTEFAILLNQKQNHRDKILQTLKQILQQSSTSVDNSSCIFFLQ